MTSPPKRNSTSIDASVTWDEAPPFLLNVLNQSERIAIRNANHQLYRETGTNSMWRKYLKLGYYVFDDCMDF